MINSLYDTLFVKSGCADALKPLNTAIDGFNSLVLETPKKTQKMSCSARLRVWYSRECLVNPNFLSLPKSERQKLINQQLNKIALDMCTYNK